MKLVVCRFRVQLATHHVHTLFCIVTTQKQLPKLHCQLCVSVELQFWFVIQLTTMCVTNLSRQQSNMPASISQWCCCIIMYPFDWQSFVLITSCISMSLQESFPMRLKAIHFVNEPAVFGAIFSLVKPFLKEKLVKRVYVPLSPFLHILC